jgi:hypothetical protein
MELQLDFVHLVPEPLDRFLQLKVLPLMSIFILCMSYLRLLYLRLQLE